MALIDQQQLTVDILKIQNVGSSRLIILCLAWSHKKILWNPNFLCFKLKKNNCIIEVLDTNTLGKVGLSVLSLVFFNFEA